jgi:hypothetical protein
MTSSSQGHTRILACEFSPSQKPLKHEPKSLNAGTSMTKEAYFNITNNQNMCQLLFFFDSEDVTLLDSICIEKRQERNFKIFKDTSESNSNPTHIGKEWEN